MNALPSRSLFAASWWLVRRPQLFVPVVLALLLTAVSLALMETDYQALRLMRGVGLILACAWVAGVDDPAGEVTAASPYVRSVRTGTRLLVSGVVAVGGWVACALAVELAVPSTPVLGMGVEAFALAALGLAVGTGLRGWRDIHMPSHLAVVGLIALALATSLLPRWYVLIQPQVWGPPWEASLIRWGALGMVGLGVLGLAVLDPLSRRASGFRSAPSA